MSPIAPPTATSSQLKSKPKDKGKDKSSESKAKKGKGKEPESSKAIKSKALIDDSDLESDEAVEEVEAAPEPEADSSNSLVPPGSTRLTTLLDEDDFDYDTLEGNDDLELWVLRVPEGIKPKYLSNINLSLPPPSTSTSSQKLGTLERKTATYDVWSVPSSSSTSFAVDNDEDGAEQGQDVGNSVGGEELLGLSCLLPRRRKGGKLFVVPKPITHHLVLTAQPTLPTPPPSSPEAETNNTGENAREKTGGSIYKTPARYQHPKHLLKHRFIPTGVGAGNHSSLSKAAGETVGEENGIEVDGRPSPSKATTKSTANKEKEKKKEKNETRKMEGEPENPAKKKRKAEGDSKKKSKKAKTIMADRS